MPIPVMCAHPKWSSFQAIQAKKTITARTTIMIARRALLLVMATYPRAVGRIGNDPPGRHNSLWSIPRPTAAVSPHAGAMRTRLSRRSFQRQASTPRHRTPSPIRCSTAKGNKCQKWPFAARPPQPIAVPGILSPQRRRCGSSHPSC